MFACDESTSIDCAREMRGSDSIAKPVTPRLASASMPEGSKGLSRPISSELGLSSSSSPAAGARTLSTTSAS